MSSIKVIQYGVGPIGAAIVRLITAKLGAKFVGAIDIDPAKTGKDLGRAVGLDRDLGVVISNDAAQVLDQEADVVVHSTSSYLENVSDQLLHCLDTKHNVVSSCEELSYPIRKHPELSAELDRRARNAGVTLHGTGVNPGFVMDKLPLTLSSVCQRVDSVTVTRVVDASKRREPLQRKVGAGMSEDQFRKEVAAGRIKHHGLPESIGLIADGLGLDVDRIEEVIESVVADQDITTDYFQVHRGQVAGVRQVGRGWSGTAEKVRLELRMYLGAPDPADTVVIEGLPNLTLTIPGGTHGDVATAAVVVNAIPLVLAAGPGLKTVADIPVKFGSFL